MRKPSILGKRTLPGLLLALLMVAAFLWSMQRGGPRGAQQLVRLTESAFDPQARTELTWRRPDRPYHPAMLARGSSKGGFEGWSELADGKRPGTLVRATPEEGGWLRFEHGQGLLLRQFEVTPHQLLEVSARVRAPRQNEATEAGDPFARSLMVLPLDQVLPLQKTLAHQSLSDVQRHHLIEYEHLGTAAAPRSGDWEELSLAFRVPYRARAILVVFHAGSGGEDRHVDVAEIVVRECSLRRILALGESRDPRPPVQDVQGLRDHPQRLGLTPQPWQGEGEVPVWTVDTHLQQRDAFLLPPPSDLSTTLDLPTGKLVLEFGLALVHEHRLRWGKRKTALRIALQEVGADGELGRSVLVWNENVVWDFPGHWRDATADLSRFAGRRVRLTFSTDPPAEFQHSPGADLLAIGSPTVRRRAPLDPRPNVILISLDTLRADHLGCEGYPRPTSPVLDQLAATNVWFRQVSSTAPYTLPAHASLLTGQLPSLHGVLSEVPGHNRILPGRSELLAVRLREEGYQTVAYTGGAYVAPEFGFAQGFDRYDHTDCLLTDRDPRWKNEPRFGDHEYNQRHHREHTLDHIIDWIGRHRDGRFFLFLHTYLIHNYLASESHQEMFARDTGSTLGDDLRWIRNRTLKGPIPPADLEHYIDRYDATIREADAALGRLVTYLRETELWQDTIFVVVSDHGEEFTDHGGLAHGRTLYQEMLHVPWILHAPGVSVPLQVDHPASLTDVAPTLLDLLGLEPQAAQSGQSWLPYLQGRVATPERSPVLAELDLDPLRLRMIREQSDKLIRRPSGDTEPTAEGDLLFDLSRDPHEQENLLPGSAERAEDLRRRLRKGLDEARRLREAAGVDSTEREIGDAMRQKLESLGYVGNDNKSESEPESEPESESESESESDTETDTKNGKDSRR